MDRELLRLRRRIERLRNAMVLAYLNHGGDLKHQEVLRISERLDEQLNRYVSYARKRALTGRSNRSLRRPATTVPST